MKKLFLSLISLILFCTVSAQNTVMNGDLNNDGKFSVADIVAMNNIVVKKVLPQVIDGDFTIGSLDTKAGTVLFGDMDHDGKFTFEDIKLLAETFLEIKEEEPVTGDFEVRDIVTAELINGTRFNAAIKTLANGFEMTREDEDDKIQRVVFECGSTVSSGVNVSSAENSGTPIYANYEEGVITISTPADAITATDMMHMFWGCTSLSSVDFSHFDTSLTTTMAGLFGKCLSLNSINLTSFDTRNVTDMAGMFYGCRGLTSIDVSAFATNKVTRMDEMFSGCFYLTSLDLSSFDTSNVTDMGLMFYYCRSLKELDLTNFDIRNVTNMEVMFSQCSSIYYPSSTLTVSCSDETKEAISQKGNMDMDRIIWKLQKTEQSFNGKYINAITNSEMKEGESMANFQVKDAANDLEEGFYTPEVIVGGGPDGMNCIKIESVVNPENPWDTQLFVYTPDHTWHGGERFRFHMRYKASREIGADSQIHTTPGNYIHWEVLNPNPQFTTEWKETTWTGVFPTQGDGGQTIAFNLNQNIYDDPTEVIEYYFADIRWEYGEPEETEYIPRAELIDGGTFAKTIKTIANGHAMDTSDQDSLIYTVEFDCGSSVSTGVLVSSTTSSYPIYANFENGKMTISTAADVIYTNRNAGGYFMCFTALTSVDLSHLDTRYTSSMSGMFCHCWALENLDLSTFDTSKVGHMGSMLQDCRSLTSLDLTNFDISNVPILNYMCYNLASNVSSVTIKCDEETRTKLINDFTELNQSKVKWNIEGVPCIAELVDGVTFAKTIKETAYSDFSRTVDAFDHDRVIQSVEFVCGSSESTGVLISSENSGYPIYANFENGKITISTAADVIYTGRDASNMFKYCQALSSVDLSLLDTSHATNMSGMFYQCSSLTSLDLSSFDTSNVTYMNSMCEGLASSVSSLSVICNEGTKAAMCDSNLSFDQSKVVWNIVE